MQRYLTLLRTNRNFRRLWYGQTISQLGDWFDKIALFTLTLSLTGSGQAVGLLLLVEFLPATLISPLAGVLLDRLPRKLVMIASDIGRAALVLLLLFVRQPEDIWLLYTAVAAKVALAAFFEPARSAILPRVCSREELPTANAISSATWSAMLAIGASLGGIVVGTLGVTAAFVLDAASFLLSALVIATIRVHEPGVPPATTAAATSRVTLWSELREGFGYLLTQPALLWIALCKAIWSLGGGILLLLTLFGREVFPLGRDGAISIGILYAMRGIGAGIGPFLALRIGGAQPEFLRRAIPLGFWITGLGYLGLSIAPNLPVAALLVLVAHIGGSTQWVFSTALIQQQVPDRLLGRVFSTEYAAMTLATALSAFMTGVIADQGVTPWSLAIVLACIFLLSGGWMVVALRRSRVREDAELVP